MDTIASNNCYGRKMPYANSLTDSHTPNLEKGFINFQKIKKYFFTVILANQRASRSPIYE